MASIRKQPRYSISMSRALQSCQSLKSVSSDVLSIVDAFSRFELSKGCVAWEMEGLGEVVIAFYNNIFVCFRGQ